jgi:hypothetical protein
VLLAVIFSSENAPDCQTCHGAGISQNISAVFSRISAILGLGTLQGKIVSDGEAVQVKERVLFRFYGGILDPQNRPFFHFRILQPVKVEFRLPIGNKKAGFLPCKIGYLRFPAIKPEIGELVIKNTPIRPAGGYRLKSEYARIKPRLPF